LNSSSDPVVDLYCRIYRSYVTDVGLIWTVIQNWSPPMWF